MADKKVSELTTITGADTAADDFFLIVDTSGSVSKKISRTELNNAIERDIMESIDIDGGAITGVTIDNSVIGGTTAAAITGTTITGTSFVTSGDMTFGDNDKAIFGAGSDLQIYHNGTESFIDDAGTGNLRIRGSDIQIQDATGYNFIRCTDTGNAGDVKLYYQASEKLATTSTGIDVTGTVVSDGLTSVASVTAATLTNSDNWDSSHADDVLKINLGSAQASNTGGYGGIKIGDSVSSTKAIGIYARSASTFSNNVLMDLYSGGSSAYTRRATIGEDTILYASDGTTQGFYWDGSAQALGIGRTSPAVPLDVGGNIRAISSTGAASLSSQNDGNVNGAFIVRESTYSTYGAIAANNLNIYTGSSDIAITADGANNIKFGAGSGAPERMRITSSGEVGIGTTNTTGTIGSFNGVVLYNSGVIAVAATSNRSIFSRRSTDGDIIEFRKDSTAVGNIGTSSGGLTIGSGSSGTTALTLDSSQNATFAGTILIPNDDYLRGDGKILIGNENGNSWTRVNTENTYIGFTKSSTVLARLDTDGLKFNNDTAAANALDDYEEGTWTPTFIGSSSDPTVTYSFQIGRYTKKGREVTAYFRISCSAVSGGSGDLRIGGLPFTHFNVSNLYASGSVGYTVYFVTNTPDKLTIPPNETYIQTRYGSSSTVVSVGDLQAGTQLMGSMTYFV